MASGLNLKTAPSWWHGGNLDHLAALTHAEAHPSADFAIPDDVSAETKKTFQALKKRRPTFQQVKDGKGKFKFIDLFAGGIIPFLVQRHAFQGVAKCYG